MPDDGLSAESKEAVEAASAAVDPAQDALDAKPEEGTGVAIAAKSAEKSVGKHAEKSAEESTEGAPEESTKPGDTKGSRRGLPKRMKVLVAILVVISLGLYFMDDPSSGKPKKKKMTDVAVAQALAADPARVDSVAEAGAATTESSAAQPANVQPPSKDLSQDRNVESSVSGKQAGQEAGQPQVAALTAMTEASQDSVEPPDEAMHTAIPASLLLAEVSMAVPLGLFLQEVDADGANGVRVSGIVSAGRRLESLALLTEYIDALNGLPFLIDVTEDVSYLGGSEDLNFSLRAQWSVGP